MGKHTNTSASEQRGGKRRINKKGRKKKVQTEKTRKKMSRKKAEERKPPVASARTKRKPVEEHAAVAVMECPADTPRTPDELHAWIAAHLGVRIARTALVEHHAAPFDYLIHTFFEGAFPSSMGLPAHDVATGSLCNQLPTEAPQSTDSESSSSSKSQSTSKAPPRSSPDCIVWANRGGGKTFLAAIATLLDLLFKPGCQVRILAGSIEQGLRMHGHLRSFLEREKLEDVAHRITARRISIPGRRTSVEILAASQTSVRGTRVQKLRCDEVDLFDHYLWAAAQLVTRSLPGVKGPWGDTIRGAVEALSTMHRPFGLMWKLVGDPGKEHSPLSTQRALRKAGEEFVKSSYSARVNTEVLAVSDQSNSSASLSALGALSGESSPPFAKPRNLFRWGLLDVLEHCPPERECGVCALEPECRGRAKFTPLTCEGHITIDDATNMKMRVGRETWEAEMLCLRPSRTNAVYPEFDVRVHVRTVEEVGWAHDVQRTALPQSRQDSGTFVKMIAGFDFGYRCEAVILLAGVTRSGRVHVVREHCNREQVVSEQIDAMEHWRAEGLFRFHTEPGGEPPLEFVGIDPAGNGGDAQTGRSCAQLLTSRGYHVRARASQIYPGLLLVRDRLSPTWVARRSAAAASLSPRSAWGPALFRGDQYDPMPQPGPQLLIDPCCTRLIECLSRYHFDDARPESLEPVKDGVDHACDALRYMILNLERPHKTEVSNYLSR